ncbi:MAG: tetratricopeptide repeat protein [Acidobacteriota bacterium]
MRALSAPALLVCLAGAAVAGDWDTTIQKGTEAFHRGAWTDALLLFESAWPMAETPVEQAITANDIGATLHAVPRDRDALPWFRRSVSIWQSLPNRPAELTETGLGLVDVYRVLGDFPAAETTLHDLLKAGVGPEQRGALYNTLGDVLREQVRNDEARRNFEAALALESLSPKRRTETWLGLADLDRGEGNFTASIEGWNRALDFARAARSASDEALALRGLGLTRIDAGDFAKAGPALRRSLALFQQEPIPQFRQLAAAYTCLGRFYGQQGKLSLGEEAYLQALALERKNSGENHPQTAVIMEALAGIYAMQKRFGEAHDLASHALRTMTASFGEKSIPAAGALATVALVEQLENRLEPAAADYASAIGTMRARGAASNQNTLDVMDRYAQVLTSLRRPDEAKELRKFVKAFRPR